MTTNVGWLDAAIRWALAVVLFAAAILLHESLVMTFGCALVAMVLAGTAATRHCPFYGILRFHTGRWGTKHREREHPAH
ncbi:MAG: DUF2892 domain-containing protein [Gemmatimonadetes bacterium]|nr:DUF2892 domain-containing protein [Gemmatimonadota bacterium]